MTSASDVSQACRRRDWARPGSLDFVLFGIGYQRVQRLVIIAAQETAEDTLTSSREEVPGPHGMSRPFLGLSCGHPV